MRIRNTGALLELVYAYSFKGAQDVLTGSNLNTSYQIPRYRTKFCAELLKAKSISFVY